MIVTNDFMVCAYLIEHGRCRLYHTGGQVIRENQSCAGRLPPTSCNLHLDIAFPSQPPPGTVRDLHPERTEGAGEASRGGVGGDAHPHLRFVQMGKVGTFNVVSWDAIDQVITDEQLPQSAREALAQHGGSG